jgi:hypothetical protein
VLDPVELAVRLRYLPLQALVELVVRSDCPSDPERLVLVVQ